MNPTKRLLAILISMVMAGSGRADDPLDFQRDVFPILESHCLGCHSADEAEGGFVMDSHATMMAGGESGVAVTAGSAGSSRMLGMIRGQLEPVMPPEGESRPSDEEIEMLANWVDQGAVGPDGDLPIKRPLRTPAIETKPGVSMPITAIAISRDGSRRAIARYGSVQILDESDRVVANLDRELNKVNSIEFSNDGTRTLVASGLTGAYGSAAIFATETGELLSEFVGHRDVLYAAVFSPDERQIATAGYDREIILWDVASGEPVRSFSGHNGAIYGLAYSPDGQVIVSACADETLKVWRVDSGERLDTLSQPEGDVFAVAITADGKHILAGSADNRLRVWQLRSKNKARINPLVATRFVDESPIVNFSLTPDGNAVVVLSEAGNVKVIRTSDWNQAAALEPLGETGSDLSVSPDGRTISVSLMSGKIVTREMPALEQVGPDVLAAERPVYLDLGELSKQSESELRQKAVALPMPATGSSSEGGPTSALLDVPRGAEIAGQIAAVGEVDGYRWEAGKGEVWAIDADAAENSRIDPVITIFDVENRPVLRTRLQAIRDSYFTFRGKDSMQVADFRLFNWEEMHLNDYLYAAGEVTKLWMYPRGPDSGYNVYPNEGDRWTYFGTTHTTHALGEPAYVVRPLPPGAAPTANGLPVFDLVYENDDDPMRVAGKNSRLLFTAPNDAHYTVRIADTRGDGGEAFGYRLTIRPASPGFLPSVSKANGTLRRGTGREFIVRVDRRDGFEGPVTFEIPDLPPEIASNVPLTIESGQRFAMGTLWVSEDSPGWEGTIAPEVIATATINGRVVERRVGPVGELTLGDRPSAIPSIHPVDRNAAENETWTLSLRRGETATARVVIRRKENFTKEVSFGKEDSGRNTTHGVYVDNIGLNGLLVRENETEREFFLTADPIAQPGKRYFFLRAEIDGNVTSHPIVVEVLP